MVEPLSVGLGLRVVDALVVDVDAFLTERFVEERGIELSGVDPALVSLREKGGESPNDIRVGSSS